MEGPSRQSQTPQEGPDQHKQGRALVWSLSPGVEMEDLLRSVKSLKVPPALDLIVPLAGKPHGFQSLLALGPGRSVAWPVGYKKGSRSPCLEGNRPGSLEPPAPLQGNGRFLAPGPRAGPKDSRAQSMHSGTQERHGVVDSGVLGIPRAELEGLECMAEGAGLWTPRRIRDLEWGLGTAPFCPRPPSGRGLQDGPGVWGTGLSCAPRPGSWQG